MRSPARLLRRYSRLNWALADQTLVSGANFLTNIVIARSLGLAEFGRFSVAWLALLFATNLQMALIVAPMMSIASKQPDERRDAYFGAVLVHQVVFAAAAGLVFGAVGLLLAPLLGGRGWLAGLTLAATTVALQGQEFLRRYFFTRARPGSAFLIDAVGSLGRLAVLFAMFRTLAMGSLQVFWVVVAACTAAVLLGGLVAGRFRFDGEVLRSVTPRHWEFGKWLGVSSLMQWLNGQFFLLASGALLGESALGALRAAQTLLGLNNVVFMGLSNVAPIRAAAHLHHGGVPALRRYMRRVGWFAVGAVALVSLPFAVAPEFWLAHVFRPEFVPYAGLVRLYVVVTALFVLCQVLRWALRALEDTNAIFRAYLVTSAFTLLSSYPLLARLGVTGAMIGLILVNALMAGSLYRRLRARLATHHAAAP